MMQQLFIDGQLVDIGHGTEVNLTFVSNLLTGAADFKGNRSLTISLPDTTRNRAIIQQAQVVQGGGAYPYQFHNIDYYRNGVQLIGGGVGRVTSVTSGAINIAIVWGVRTSVEALLGSDKSINALTTPAYIEFNAQPTPTQYADALTDDVFYASIDTELHESENAFYHVDVEILGSDYTYTEERPTATLLHPSVRMNWLLSLMEAQYGVTIDWDAAQPIIDTMIVPLVKKIPNSTTYNNGYRAAINQPLQGSNVFRFTTGHASPIIAAQSNPPEGTLVCATAFSGVVRYTIALTIDVADLISVSYPIVRAKYGYNLALRIGDTWHSCTLIPEGMTFNAHDIAGNTLNIRATGQMAVEMAVDDIIALQIEVVDGGTVNPSIVSDTHFVGGTLYVSEIVGKENEVQPGQNYPVEGNLPDIKPIDLVKFLAAVTGMFPVQASTASALLMRPVSSVFDWDNAVDWSGRILSPTNRPIAASKDFAVEGWAQKNWFKWKDDDTVKGDYNGSIDIEDQTIDTERDVVTFPFAATDGNNVPLYTKTLKPDLTYDIKYKAVQPRVLTMSEGTSGVAVAEFDMDMKRIIPDHYGDLCATMLHPSVITETIRISDVELSRIDETKPIYIAQHGAYFALLELSISGNNTAEAKLLKLTKQEEIE